MSDLIFNNINNLHIKYSPVQPGNIVELFEFQKAMNAVDALSLLNFLEEDIERLKELKAIYSNKSDNENIMINVDTLNKFEPIMASIRNKSYAVLDAIDQAIDRQSANSLSFKLPDSYDSLDKVTHFFQELNLSLKLGLKEDNFKVQAFDSGSFWVELLFNNPETLQFLSSIISSATNIAQSILKSKETEKQLIGLDDETIQKISAHLEASIAKEVEAKVLEILESNGNIPAEPEDKVKLEKSVKTMAELLSEGTTVTPALNAPPEIKESFPIDEDYQEIKSRIIMLSPIIQKKINSHQENEVEDNEDKNN